MFSTKKTHQNSSLEPGSPQEVGQEGENLSEKYLKSQGFRIIARNYRCRGGEIDLIAEKKGELHFIEVKSRTGSTYGSSWEAVTSFKRKRMATAAHWFLLREPEWRKKSKVFSVIGIDQAGPDPRITFFPNAFELDGNYY